MFGLIYLIILIFISLIGIWLPLPFFFRLTAVTLATCFIPGWLIVCALDPSRKYLGLLEKIILAFGLSFGLTILGALVVLYVGGQLTREGIIVWLSVTGLILSIIYGWRARRQQTRAEPAHLTYSDFFYGLIPLLVAALFSLVNLHYADFWSDEMNGLLRAISIIGGRQETIFEHTKGPVEVLLPAVFGLLVQQFDPFTVRFPFALAYTVGVGSLYLLTKRLFTRNVALLAGLLLAINGMHLAFGRIVQYQSIVLLEANLSILLAYLFYSTGKRNLLWLSAFLAAIGLLAHYDMLLVLPIIAYLVGNRYRQNRLAWRHEWPQWAGAAAIFLLISAIFYIPFFLHPQASETSSYLARRISLNSLISNNFDELYKFSVAYNSSYYLIFVMVFSLGCLTADLYSVRLQAKNIWLWVVITVAFGLVGVVMLAGQFYLFPVIVFILLFILLVFYSAASFELNVVYFWVGVSFIGYMFLVDDPRSHLRIIYPGVSILAALGVVRAFKFLGRYVSGQRHRGMLLAVGGTVLGLCLALFAGYQYLLFVDTQREYIFTYPKFKSELYWEDPDFPFGSRRLYGAPHRLGWQQINKLYLQGYFEGDWNSNDEGSNLFWYTLGTPRNHCYARYYFLTHFEQKPGFVQYLPDLVAKGYVKIGEVWNRDRLQIEVFEFLPAGYKGEMNIWLEPRQYPLFTTPPNFQRDPYEDSDITLGQVSHPLSPQAVFKPHPKMLEQVAEQYGDPRITNIHDKIALVGYDVDETWAQPGGALVLTLYWQAVDNINLPYKVSARLESQAGELWSQADDFPVCGAQPAYQWPVGRIIADRHALHLPQGISEGDYDIKIGLYEPQTNLHLDLLDSLENPAGISFRLDTITLPGSPNLVE